MEAGPNAGINIAERFPMNFRSLRDFRSALMREGTAMMKPRNSLPWMASFLWHVGILLGLTTLLSVLAA